MGRSSGLRGNLLISDDYRRLLIEKHAQPKTSFGTSGGRLAVAVDVLMMRLDYRTILDYGCGQGCLKTTLENGRAFALPYEVREYDPAIAGKDHMPEPADLVVCSDVLEHIEPECLDNVLDHIAILAQHHALLWIATCPAQKHLPDGRNAHLIIRPVWWWLPKLADRWHIENFQGEQNCVAARVATKR